MKALLFMLLLLVACNPLANNHRTIFQELRAEKQVVDLLGRAVSYMRIDTPESLDSAFNALELARDLKPNDPRVLDGLGCVEWRRKNFDLAKLFFQKALRQNPSYDRPYAHLAVVAQHDGNTQAAKELNQIAIKLNPMNYRARNNYAVLLMKEGLNLKARDELLKAIHSSQPEQSALEENLKLNLEIKP